MTHAPETRRRRTFAIISHPDAGKTTLTEKLLLFSGAIQIAGSVKARKASRHATSDWMEIEKQRGISVASSVMQMQYREHVVNLLDTPGHKDFSEDTYRVLTAVDSALMVIDAANGVESQTRRLIEVCRQRDTPIITFVNKMDREVRDPLDILDEVERELGMPCVPMTWPVGIGKRFKGVYDLSQGHFNCFQGDSKTTVEELLSFKNLQDPQLEQRLGSDAAEQLRTDVELITGVYEAFNPEMYRQAHLSPVFFGSAVNNFGIKELLDCFVKIAPPPLARPSSVGPISPQDKGFSGFIFKIHANLDPKHRDRIAFLRICSGQFERNTYYYQVRTGKQLRFSDPTAFMAQQKSVIDEAYPGDVIGLYDAGNFKIGDTLTQGKNLHFEGIPHFSPELFRYVTNLDPMKTKQLQKGLDQLTDEGVAQLFSRKTDGRKIIGTVGALQFEVIQHRLKAEYNASVGFEPLNVYKALWFKGEKADTEAFMNDRAAHVAFDKEERAVFLAESAWILQMAQEKFPKIRFFTQSEA